MDLMNQVKKRNLKSQNGTKKFEGKNNEWVLSAHLRAAAKARPMNRL